MLPPMSNRVNEVIQHSTRSVNCRLRLHHSNIYHAYEYSQMNKTRGSCTAIELNSMCYQAIPQNDQNACPTNQKAARSKLDRTGYLMLYGSWRHLESFSGGFLVRICLLGCLLRYLVKSLIFNGTIFE